MFKTLIKQLKQLLKDYSLLLTFCWIWIFASDFFFLKKHFTWVKNKIRKSTDIINHSNCNNIILISWFILVTLFTLEGSIKLINLSQIGRNQQIHGPVWVTRVRTISLWEKPKSELRHYFRPEKRKWISYTL